MNPLYSKQETPMKTTTRSPLIFPAWLLICSGAVAFLYCASAGLLLV
jgi:hypothetical protein